MYYRSPVCAYFIYSVLLHRQSTSVRVLRFTLCLDPMLFFTSCSSRTQYICRVRVLFGIQFHSEFWDRAATVQRREKLPKSPQKQPPVQVKSWLKKRGLGSRCGWSFFINGGRIRPFHSSFGGNSCDPSFYNLSFGRRIYIDIWKHRALLV